MDNFLIQNSEGFQSSLQKLKDAKQIVLFGAGELAYFSILRLDYLGIKSNIMAIVDNDTKKIGGSIEKISIISMGDLKKYYPNAIILITIGNIDSQLAVLKQLKNNGFCNFISHKAMLEPYQFTKIKEPYLANREGQGTVLKSVVMSITTKCSLCCQHCSYLTPYMETQQHIDKNLLIKSVINLSKSVNTINAFALVGGEPFLHPELTEICEEIGKIPNIKFKNIITNATIIPKIETLRMLSKYDIAIFYSDYGNLSTKIESIKTLCKEHNVIFRPAYNTLENEPTNWFTTEYPKRQNRPTHTNVEKYNKCSACNIILNGKFYVCVYAAFGTMLNAIPKNDDDFVDLVNSLLTNEEIANKLKKLLIETTTLTACDYCPDESVPVPIADQVDPHQFRITKKRK